MSVVAKAGVIPTAMAAEMQLPNSFPVNLTMSFQSRQMKYSAY
jgi:hypothetical protein